MLADDPRLRTLLATRLLDSPPERSFDRLTRLAAKLLDAPVALVSLVDDRRQFFKSSYGEIAEPYASARETPLSHSFCQVAVRQRAQLIVTDARDDPRVRDNPAVGELGVIAYAGVPLMVDSQPIGAFCVVDGKPRQWSDEQLQLLDDLAESVVSEIELRMALRSESDQRALIHAVLDSIGEGVIAANAKGIFTLVNPAAKRMFANTAVVGGRIAMTSGVVPRSQKLDGSILRAEESALVRALVDENTNDLTLTYQAPGTNEPVWIEASGRPVHGENGQVIAGVAVYRDVTEKMRQTNLHETILRSVPRTSIAVFDHDLRCVAFDGGVTRAPGAPAREDMIGRPMAELAGLAPDDPKFKPVIALYRKALSGDEGRGDYTHLGRIYELLTAPVRDAVGRVTHGIVLAQDRTLERSLESSIRRSELVHRAIVENLPNGSVVMVDRNFRSVIAEGTEDLIASFQIDRELLAPAFDGLTICQEIERGGRFLEVHAVPIFEESEVTHLVVLLYDVTDRRLEANLLNTTLENIEDGVALLDNERRVVFANKAYSAMFGLSQRELQGLSRDQFFAHVATLVDDAEYFRQRVDVLKDTGDYVLQRPRRRVLRRAETPITLKTGEASLVSWHDVTSERELLAERERQLTIDALTGIMNRRGAEAALSLEEARRKRGGLPFSVAVFDVDHFKRVNDTFGHATGDEVLRLVAATLARQARMTDHVARWGGEEFLAVLPGNLEGALVFAERARLAVAATPCPKVEHVTISVGVAEVGPDETPAAAIARADEGLYEAKRKGRNRVESRPPFRVA